MTELAIAQRALELTTAAAPNAEVEVAVNRSRLALTRFANSVIHQNVADDSTSVRIRMHVDGRTASGSSTLTDDDGLAALATRTVDAARVAPLDPGWPGVAPRAAPGPVAAVDPATADATADARAALVGAFVDAAGGLEAAGYCRTSHWTGAFVNSLGQELTGESAEASMDGIARQAGVDGVARLASSRLADLDGGVLGARAAAKVQAGPIRSSSRPAGTRSCSSRRRSPTCCRTWRCGASAARPSTNDDPSPSSARRSSTPG